MDVKIPQDKLDVLIQETLLAALTEERKEALVREAFNQALTNRNKYSNKTILEEALEKALRDKTEILAKKIIEDNEIVKQITQFIEESIKILLTPERKTKIVEKISEKLSDAIFERY